MPTCPRSPSATDAPYYLFPGVETKETALLCLLERRRYQRRDAAFNMSVELAACLPDPEGDDGPGRRTPGDRAELAAWLDAHWPHWCAEALRALDQDTLVVARDGEGIERHRARTT